MPNWWMDGQTGRQQWFYRTLPNIESLNRKTNMQIFRWPSARKQFSSTTSKNVFLMLTSTGLISVIFIEPDDHQFMASNSRGLARVFLGGGLNVGYHGWWRKFGILNYINTVCTKSASKDSPNCFAIFGSSACRG